MLDFYDKTHVLLWFKLQKACIICLRISNMSERLGNRIKDKQSTFTSQRKGHRKFQDEHQLTMPAPYKHTLYINSTQNHMSLHGNAHKGPVMQSFCISSFVNLKKLLDKQSSCWWFDAPVMSLWAMIWSKLIDRSFLPKEATHTYPKIKIICDQLKPKYKHNIFSLNLQHTSVVCYQLSLAAILILLMLETE